MSKNLNLPPIKNWDVNVTTPDRLNKSHDPHDDDPHDDENKSHLWRLQSDLTGMTTRDQLNKHDP